MDHDFVPRIKTLIDDSGKSIRQTAKDAGVSYFRLNRILSGRTSVFDIYMADKLWLNLTGKKLLP